MCENVTVDEAALVHAPRLGIEPRRTREGRTFVRPLARRGGVQLVERGRPQRRRQAAELSDTVRKGSMSTTIARRGANRAAAA
jgi:hypothetical protein